ncbi:hypothetical protein D3C71_77210 [compost metagenome]
MIKRATVCFAIVHAPSGTVVFPDLQIEATFDVQPDSSEDDQHMAAVDAAFPKVPAKLNQLPGGTEVYANRHEHSIDPTVIINHPIH